MRNAMTQTPPVNAMRIVYSPRCLDYAATGHPESPDRVRATVAALQQAAHTWLTPVAVTDRDILRVHTPAMLVAVRTGKFADGDTPVFPNIYELACLSAGSAVMAAEQARAGHAAFAVMRPPGHHATRDRAMGFCYLNSIAIAALEARAAGFQRVAVFDFDVHHGNGTEDILIDQPGCAFISVHQYPCYPGTGRADCGANCFNFPVPG